MKINERGEEGLGKQLCYCTGGKVLEMIVFLGLLVILCGRGAESSQFLVLSARRSRVELIRGGGGGVGGGYHFIPFFFFYSRGTYIQEPYIV